MKFHSRLAVLLTCVLSGCGGHWWWGSDDQAAAASYTVTAGGDGNETISPTEQRTARQGSTLSFAVTAADGYGLSNTVGGTCPPGTWTGPIYTTGAITASCAVSFSAVNLNAPWYASINSFEDHDSGRSRLFSRVSFGGDIAGGNTVNTSASASSYPSLSSMVYIDANQVFAYGGGYGDQAGSIGSFVAKIDPATLAPVWNTQLTDTSVSGEWDYPGTAALLDDGYLYVVYGYRLSKVDTATGAVMTTVLLPTGAGLAQNTAYNGFDATPDGILVMKSTYRQAGCGIQGPSALLNCPDPSDIPPSVLVSVDPRTMTVMHQLTLPAPTFGKVTIGTYRDQRYVYLSEATTWVRYAVSSSGDFALDNSWNPGTLVVAGQSAGSGMTVMNDWVVGQTNASPASTALSVVAVNQGNAQTQFSVQPFLGDPIPPLISAAFSFAGPGGTQAISWAPSSVSSDPATGVIYATDALPGEMAAVHLDSSGMTTLWKANQMTTESLAVIGLQSERIVVGTDIPGAEIPGNNSHDYAVWRNAATGAEIARSPLLSASTPGSMVHPYYSGDMFYGGVGGSLVRLVPTH